MPVRSLHSSVLKWPDAAVVDRAVRTWTADLLERLPGIAAIGYFGSYARGDWGVGSDLDLVAVVEETTEPFERRAAQWDLNRLPVPAEILVYSRSEWAEPAFRRSRFARSLRADVVWTHNAL